MSRKLPRKFEFPFGKGNIIEEVSIKSEYHEPTIQLLEFDSGEKSIRFCFYHGSRFGRAPLLIDEKDLKLLKIAAQKSKQIKKMLDW